LPATSILPLLQRDTLRPGISTTSGLATDPVHRHADGYLPVLDGFRAFSIALVLLCHLTYYHATTAQGKFLSAICGSTGVSFFFVISGFLITRILIREERRRGQISLRRFYLRRALRILPAYYLFVVVVVLLDRAGAVPRVPVHNYASCLLFVRNLIGRGHETSHLWSLSLEEQFYVFWPMLLAFVAGGKRLGAVTSLLLAACLWRSYLVFTGRVGPLAIYDRALYMRSDLRMDTILAGCALGILYDAERFRRFNRAFLSRAWVPWAAGLALVLWSVFAPGARHSAAIENSITAVLIGVILNWFLANGGSLAGRGLQAGPVLLVGKLSYSLYLWQQLFLGPAGESLAALRRFPVNVLMTIVAAVASYVLVEKPFLALKERYCGT
jgi:peptidoglycan/LPS O-acetylase OafA/YrhL